MGRRRKDTRRSGSLGRNILFFCISISILTGASVLFHSIIQWPDLPLRELFTKEHAKIAGISNPTTEDATEHSAVKPGKGPQKGVPAPPPETASINTYKYSFYDILTHQNRRQKLAEEKHFCVQVGAFKSHQSAQEMSDELKRTKRLNCRLTKKGNLTVVVWGNFPTKSAADRSNKQLSRMLERQCLVIEMG